MPNAFVTFVSDLHGYVLAAIAILGTCLIARAIGGTNQESDERQVVGGLGAICLIIDLLIYFYYR